MYNAITSKHYDLLKIYSQAIFFFFSSWTSKENMILLCLLVCCLFGMSQTEKKMYNNMHDELKLNEKLPYPSTIYSVWYIYNMKWNYEFNLLFLECEQFHSIVSSVDFSFFLLYIYALQLISKHSYSRTHQLQVYFQLFICLAYHLFCHILILDIWRCMLIVILPDRYKMKMNQIKYLLNVKRRQYWHTYM